MKRGLALAALHCGILLTLAGKYQYDRATLPRVWAKCGPVDPNLPLRGRYMNLRLEVSDTQPMAGRRYRLEVREGRLAGVEGTDGVLLMRGRNADAEIVQSVPYFIAEHADAAKYIPKAGEALWAEVSVPKEGLPRVIQVEMRKADR